MTIEEFKKMEAKKNRGKAMASEHDLQVTCVNWFHLAYPKHTIYAIPNGGARTPAGARALKAEGVLAGIPDLHIPIPNKDYHSLYIEIKNGKSNGLNENQKKIIPILESYGNMVCVCRNFDEFREAVDAYFG